ncbi:MAG TPA: hypothetical protein VK826_03380, partial [Bacteroidia bacterium]|nr:hypothetical protein [Bacteroidia bacterium]
ILHRSQVEDQRSMQYCTLPYAIIHWPGDTSEKGPMHKDGYFYIRDFYTTWTPLNENTHEPLLINEYSHIRKGLLSRKLRLPSFAPSGVLVKPHIGLGDFIAWHGNTDHEGLLNTSKEVTVSLVFRFTSSPIMLESTQPCADLEHGKISSGELDVADFSRLTAKIFRQIEEENKNVSLAYTDITALCNSIQSSVESWKLNRVDQHKIAFVLALWAQRMENRRDVKLFYLYACIASAHVLYPVQQVMRNLLNNSPESNAMNFAKWTIRKYPYKQHEFVLHEEIYTKNRNGGNMHVHIPENLPWVKWME